MVAFGLAHNVLMEVELPKKRRQDFSDRYYAATGKRPNGQHFQSQEDKWGVECRIYFDAPAAVIANLKKAGYHVEHRSTGYGSDRPYRVNSQELFWDLVDQGYRLGIN